MIGVVAHETGRLATLGPPLRFAAQAYQRVGDHGVSIPDSRSTPEGCHRRCGGSSVRIASLWCPPSAFTGCSRWLSYPVGARESGVDGVVTPVYWTQRHPCTSSPDGSSCADLAAGHTAATGQGWSQPLGVAYALFGVAQQKLARAEEPDAIGAVLANTRLATGQWQRAGDGVELRVVANEHVPPAGVEADLAISR